MGWGVNEPDYNITDEGEELAKDLKEARELDKILKAFVDHPKIPFQKACEIAGVPFTETSRIILQNDGYIETMQNIKGYFRPTIKGQKFQKVDGGYAHDLIDEKLLGKTEKLEEKKSIDHATWQNYAKWFFIIAAGVVGLLKAFGVF